MVNYVHVIDPDFRRRARVSRELKTYSLHAEIYEDLEEFLEVAPAGDLVLAFDDLDQNGQCVCELLRTGDIELPVIGYAEDPSAEQIVNAMLAGAAGYLQWPFDTRHLLRALRKMSQESEARVRRERVASRAKKRVRSLSNRERQVLAGLISGLSNKRIAQALEISPRTVEIHR